MPATISHALSMTTPDNTAYENRPSHWNATHALTLSATGSEIIGAFSNANGLSFGLSAGAVTASHNALTTAALSDHSHGNPTLNLTNLSGTTASNSAGFTLSLSAGAGGAGDGVNILAAGTQTANTTGTVLFSNSNGISFGMSNSSILTASHNALTTAMASNRGSDFVQATAAFAGTSASGTIASNGISVSIGPYITTAMLSNAVTLSNIRVSAGTTSNLLSALTFGDGNGISFGLNASTLTASHNGLTSQSNQALSGANGSFTFQTATFANSNGVSFSTGTQGLYATVKTDYLTTAALSNHSHGVSFTSGSVAFQTLSFTNSNGISFNSGTQGIFASHNALTTARASNDAVGLNTAQTNVTWTVNSSGLSLNAAGYAGTGTSATNASITLNSNGLAISVAAPGGGVTPVASASNGSFSFTTLGFSNANNVTFGTSAGSIITASVAAPGAAAENNWVNLLGANTAGNTTASGSTIGYSGINLTLSGTNGSVVNISAPATSSLVGTQGISISTNGSTISIGDVFNSSYENLQGPNQTMTLNGASISHAVAFNLVEPMSISYLRIPVSMSTNSTTIATTAATLSGSVGIFSTWNAVIYSLGVGGNSRSLQSVASGSNGWTFSNSISVAVNGTQYSVTQGFSGNAEGAGTTRTTQYSISNTNYSYTTNQIATEWSAGRYLDIPFANSLSAGAYWLVFGYSSSSATNSTGVSAASNCRVFYSNHYGYSQQNVAIGVMGSTNITSNGLGAGSFSTAGGGTTASLPLSAISSSASHVRPYFQFIRQA